MHTCAATLLILYYVYAVDEQEQWQLVVVTTHTLTY